MEVLTASGKAALEKVASRDETRPVLCGVQLTLDAEQEEKGRVTGWLAATDSYKLALVPVSFDRDEKPVEGVWPAAAFKQGKRFTRMMFTKESVKVQRDGGDIVEHRRIDGQYPNWKMLMPDEGALVGLNFRLSFNARLLYELAQGLGSDHVILEPLEATDGTPNPLRPIRVRAGKGTNGAGRSVDEGPLGIIMPIKVAA